MRIDEILDLRIPETRAREYLGASVGKTLPGGRVRQVLVAVGDPLWAEIATIERRLRARGDYLYLGWTIARRYTREEIADAEAFRLFFTRVFEPPGELCGTVYDESSACSFCGVGRTQVSDLVLDLRRAPGTDLAATIADEYVVSHRLAKLLRDESIRGVELRPVRDVREIDEPEERGGEALDTPRHQLMFDHHVPLASQTRFGVDFVDSEADARDACPLGHVAGLNVLSELFVPRAAMADVDVAASDELVGRRAGVLVPQRLAIISPRVRQVLITNRVTGWDCEVARLV